MQDAELLVLTWQDSREDNLKQLHLGYLHLVEARVGGTSAADAVYKDVDHSNDVFIDHWGEEMPVIVAGGFTPEKAGRVVNDVHPTKNVLVAFGRYFIANPDLPFRLQRSIKLCKWDDVLRLGQVRAST